jgi:hypothetical protein
MTQPLPDPDPATDLTPEQVLEHDAQFAMMEFREQGQLRPRIYAVTSDHKLLAIPFQPPDTQDEKILFSASVTLTFVAYSVVRYTHMMEAWFAQPAPDETDTRPPSQRPDRREALVVTAVSRDKRLIRVHEIIRDRRGKVTDLPLFLEESQGQFESWLCEFLPEREPTAADRVMARKMLPALGIQIEERAYQPPVRH